jgi:hypothetical protein
MGGLEYVVAECARNAGLTETRVPRRGDIGVVRLGRQKLSAICLGQRWAIKSRRGVVVEPAEVLKAWSVPHG